MPAPGAVLRLADGRLDCGCQRQQPRAVPLLHGEPQERRLRAQQLSAPLLLLQVRGEGVEEAEELPDLQLQDQERHQAVRSLKF